MNKKKEAVAGWLFMTPALFIFLTLVLIPVISSIILSFTKWNFLSGFSGIEFTGVNNFIKLFTKDRKFKKALVNTVIYAITIAPTTVALSLFLAHMLNTKVYLKKFLRMCFFIPYISSMVALAAVFRYMFRTDGPVNLILGKVFVMGPVPNWMIDGSLCRIPVILVMIYAGIGFCVIVYMAALQAVPSELYEAAQIDGASAVRSFFKITLPLVSSTTFYLLIVRLIAAFKIFTAVNVMDSNGGAVSVVEIIYDEAFGKYNFGYASAASWVLVAIILLVTLLQMWGQKKWVHY